MSAADRASPYDVFLCHNSSEKPAVCALKLRLAELGLSVWLDVDELRPGLEWMPGVEEALRASASVAVLVGSDGLGPWQESEWQAALLLAKRDRRPVIPVLLPSAPPISPELPLFLEIRTWVDLRAGYTVEGLERLVFGIKGRKPTGGRAGATRFFLGPKLPYLCNRYDQEVQLLEVLRRPDAPGPVRPVLCLVHGEAHEAHATLVERFHEYTVPARWRGVLPSAGAAFPYLLASFRAQTEEGFAVEFRARLCEQLGLAPAESDGALVRALATLGVGLIAPYTVLRSSELDGAGGNRLDHLANYWRAFPVLPEGLRIVCLVLVKLSRAAPQPVRHSLGRRIAALFQSNEVRADAAVRAWLEAHGGSGPQQRSKVAVLPELTSARRGDLDDWAASDLVKSRLPALSEAQIQELFGGRPAVPMEEMHERLGKLLTTNAR